MTTLVKRGTIALVVGALLTLTACQATTGTTAATSAAVVVAPTVNVSAPAACHAGRDSGQPLPDPHCTPGALNPAVTPATIHSTICVSGWTGTVRPPISYTEPLKRQGIVAYGYIDTRLSRYEEDHLVPLEVGGAPSDAANLWPELGRSPNLKDKVEGAARRAVCAGSLPLATVQAGFESDWVTLGRQLGVSIP